MGNEKIKARMDLISKELSKEAAGHLIIAIAEIVKKAREEGVKQGRKEQIDHDIKIMRILNESYRKNFIEKLKSGGVKKK